MLENAIVAFVCGLRYARELRENPEMSEYEQALQEQLDLLERFAGLAPMNFAHKLSLVQAEVHRARGEILPAMKAYEQASQGALENGYLNEAGLAHALAAEFYQDLGLQQAALHNLEQAAEFWQSWGADALVENLSRRWPGLSVLSSARQDTPGSSGIAPSNIALETVTKASQILASDIVLSKLIANMMRIVIQNAGAIRGYLILKQGKQWVIEAEGDVDKTEVEVLKSIDVETREDVSTGIVNYVTRSEKMLLLHDAVNDGGFTNDPAILSKKSKSVLCFPLLNQGKVSGILYLENNLVTGAFTSERVELLQLLSSQMAMALDNARLYSDLEQKVRELRNAYEEIKNLKETLEVESTYLQEEIKLEHNFENIIGQSESIKYVLNRVEQVALTDSPVVIMGETGTGKELIARALHDISPRGKRALVKVDCAVLPRELIESELFGREKGAFTGAATTQVGRFELAKGSTIFLDELGELPLELQAKLLRVLESGEFERLGSPHTRHSNARIIAATNRILEEEVRKGRFREDLWFRLKVFPITVPPLRKHPEDIPLLVAWFLDQLAKKLGKEPAAISKRDMQRLQRYPWPGNVRELKHVIEGALITSKGKKLNFELPQVSDAAFSDFKSFEEMERDYLLRVLKAKNWRIGGEDSAASTLGMHVNTLRSRMKKLGIKRPKPQ
ncbi:MAG: sigma 54-interacting transcriptional regulator [Deltaproteobacteria bacterium]|nr:sigma 54-interacting transcriptional regulator [Deltaproteobacteria bacterium]